LAAVLALADLGSLRGTGDPTGAAVGAVGTGAGTGTLVGPAAEERVGSDVGAGLRGSTQTPLRQVP